MDMCMQSSEKVMQWFFFLHKFPVFVIYSVRCCWEAMMLLLTILFTTLLKLRGQCLFHLLTLQMKWQEKLYYTHFLLQVTTVFLIVMFQFDFARHNGHNFSIFHLESGPCHGINCGLRTSRAKYRGANSNEWTKKKIQIDKIRDSVSTIHTPFTPIDHFKRCTCKSCARSFCLYPWV